MGVHMEKFKLWVILLVTLCINSTLLYPSLSFSFINNEALYAWYPLGKAIPDAEILWETPLNGAILFKIKKPLSL